MKPFVEYYKSLGISPVKQDISDLSRHFSRRDALYRQLGISPLALRGKRVIEFGPGSGHNALYTASLEPAQYVLVDANPQALHELRALFAERGIGAGVEIVESLVEDYANDERFAYVFAEGFLPYAHAPDALARAVGRFVEPGGVLVVTCADAAATLGEVLRRFVARRFVDPDRPPQERVRALAPVFAPHLATLHGMTRSVEDWILDNIVHPFTGDVFGVDAALRVLGEDFEAYGGAPHYVVDWRWYKQIYGDRRYNERALDAFLSNVCNLLDYRRALPPHDPGLGVAVLEEGIAIYRLMQTSEASAQDVTAPLLERLERLGALVREPAPHTAASLAALGRFLAQREPKSQLLEAFAPFFGRGMQHLSLIRRAEAT